MTAWTLVFHVLGLVFWVGGLLIFTSLMARRSSETRPDARDVLDQTAKRFLSTLANPGAALTVASGVVLIEIGPPGMMEAAWLRAKLLLVVLLILLHFIAASRARNFLAGRRAMRREDWMKLHGAISLIFLAILVCVLPARMGWK